MSDPQYEPVTRADFEDRLKLALNDYCKIDVVQRIAEEKARIGQINSINYMGRAGTVSAIVSLLFNVAWDFLVG